MWCIAELDQAYIQKMEDVLAIYEKPYNPAQPVLCLDEKPISLHADVRAPIPAKPGKLAKQDNEYKRCGTANVFGVVEPKSGRHFTTATPNRSGAEFARMVEHIVKQYPVADAIHLVMDNLNTHCRKSLTDCFGEQRGGDIWDRLSVHYTPKHGSWLDQAEIELSLYSRQCLGTRRIPDLATLKRETKAWNRKTNWKRTKINWRFTRKKGPEGFPVRVTRPQRLKPNRCTQRSEHAHQQRRRDEVYFENEAARWKLCLRNPLRTNLYTQRLTNGPGRHSTFAERHNRTFSGGQRPRSEM
jgi:hypothetical protein